MSSPTPLHTELISLLLRVKPGSIPQFKYKLLEFVPLTFDLLRSFFFRNLFVQLEFGMRFSRSRARLLVGLCQSIVCLFQTWSSLDCSLQGGDSFGKSFCSE